MNSDDRAYLTDFLAGVAMHALMADEKFSAAEPEDIAAAAYEQAEAMVSERERRIAARESVS